MAGRGDATPRVLSRAASVSCRRMPLNDLWATQLHITSTTRWVVSVMDSGAEGPGFKSQSVNSFRQAVHTHCASVHQAAKLVAALLRVAGGNCRPGGE